MSDLQVVVKFCFQGLWFHSVRSRDVSSLTDTPALIKHRPEFNVWIITAFATVIKIQDQPTASCRGKEADVDGVHDQIRFGLFYDQMFSVCHCLSTV